MSFLFEVRSGLCLIAASHLSLLRLIKPKHASRLLFLLGCSLAFDSVGHGDPHDRIEELDALLAQNPDHVEYLLERADLKRRHRHFEDALTDLERVRTLSPMNPYVSYLTGLVLMELGESREAEKTLQNYIKSLPNNVRGYISLAKVLTQQERHLEAAQVYELAIERQSTPSPDHYLARALAYRRAGEPYLSKALKGLDEAISLIGPLLTFRRLAIEIEVEQGDYQKAIDRINRILREVDRKETWLVTKAKVLSLSGRLEESRIQFRLAEREIDSLPAHLKTSPAVHDLREVIFEKLNREIKE